MCVVRCFLVCCMLLSALRCELVFVGVSCCMLLVVGHAWCVVRWLVLIVVVCLLCVDLCFVFGVCVGCC